MVNGCEKSLAGNIFFYTNTFFITDYMEQQGHWTGPRQAGQTCDKLEQVSYIITNDV